MIVDEHVHLGGLFEDTDYFIKCLEESGIDFVIATPYMFDNKKIPRILKMKKIPPQLAETRIVVNLVGKIMKNKRFSKRYIKQPANDYVAEMSKKFPEKIYGMYWANPNMEIAKDIEPYLKDKNFVGIKLHQVVYPCELNRKNLEIFDLANEYKVPIFIHADNIGEIKTIMNYMDKKPNLNVIIAHMGFLERIADEIKYFPNLYFDISPLYIYKKKKLEEMIKKLGGDRFIFGTDSPCPGNQKYAVERVKKLNISETDKNKILGENIIKIIGQRITLEH